MKFTLIGGGGHCQSLLKALPEGLEPAGYTDLAPVDGMPIPWLGTDSEARGPKHIAVALGRGDTLGARRAIIDRFAGAEFVSVIAPTAIVTAGSEIGPGCALLHRVVVNGAAIGPNTIINTGAIVEHSTTIGENCFIGPGAVVCGGVTIGDDVLVGAGAVIRNGLTICGGVVIGMGAVVTADITTPGTYLGCPVKKIEKQCRK